MFMKYESEKIKEIEAITGVNYGCRGDLIPMDSLLPMIEDLVYEYHEMKYKLEEELSDEVEQREMYYEPISKMRLAGMREEDFYE